MKSIFLLLVVICPFVNFAQNSSDRDYFAQLCDINNQWLKHQEDSPNEQVHFETDNDAIQAHLLLVCNSLSKNTPANLSDNELTSRQNLIQTLREYALEKVFPTNLYHSIRTPYFVDDFDVHCAVGYLMSQSGSKDLVAEIRANENYSYIADIKTPGVSEWAQEHGFTVDELKWIQPSYSPSASLIAPVENGTNGPVNKMLINNNGGVLIAGEFDSLDLQPCLNIGMYHNNQLSCLGEGVSGQINDISRDQRGVIVFGQLTYEGDTYTMAVFNEGVWEYLNIPSREGAIATAGFSNGNKIEVAINHPTDENVQEIWFELNSTTWEKRLTVNGIVKKIGPSSLGRVYAGKFSEATTYDEQGEADETVFTNNVILKKNYSTNIWEGLSGTGISDTVNTFMVINDVIYFGGTAINDEASSGVILTRYLNNTLQPLLYASSFSGDNPVSINSIGYGQTNNSLLIGGDFHYNPVMGTSGKNLANYDVFYNSISLIASLDQKVNAIVKRNNQIYFGGDFQTNLSTTEFNHLGRVVVSSLGVEIEMAENTLNVFPNPFTDIVKIEGVTSEYDYQILDGSGRVVRNGTLNSDSTIELRDLSSGLYLMNMETENGVISKRLIKQ